ncbi:hypothetical protein ACWFR5_30360 [Streptomyces sp. NPDC055092]
MLTDLPEGLIQLQREADEEGRKLAGLDEEGRAVQHQKRYGAGGIVQAAVTTYAEEQDLNRF